VINVQGSQFTAHTEYADIVGANEVEW
jgi:hypothetical protein